MDSDIQSYIDAILSSQQAQLDSQQVQLTEHQSQLTTLTETQTEIVRIGTEQTQQLFDIGVLLIVAVFGIGTILGTAFYRIVRGAWEVS